MKDFKLISICQGQLFFLKIFVFHVRNFKILISFHVFTQLIQCVGGCIFRNQILFQFCLRTFSKLIHFWGTKIIFFLITFQLSASSLYPSMFLDRACGRISTPAICSKCLKVVKIEQLWKIKARAQHYSPLKLHSRLVP